MAERVKVLLSLRDGTAIDVVAELPESGDLFEGLGIKVLAGKCNLSYGPGPAFRNISPHFSIQFIPWSSVYLIHQVTPA